MIPPTFDLVKYDALVARGMPPSLGDTEHACVMACLNLACGGKLTDAAESPCVLPSAADFAVRLNDANWSSPTARASGMHDLGLALLGTAAIDMVEFARRLAEGTIRRVLPIALRAVGLKKEADRCEEEGTMESASAASYADAASYAADAAAYAYYAASYAAAAAAACRRRRAASAAAASAASAASDAASAASYAADAAAASYADRVLSVSAAAARASAADYVLRVSATLATEILTEMRGAL